jgi:anaerobic selenocysteine-containing dehydrogenase
MSKLYQESDLLLAPNVVALNPQDATACGIDDGGRGTLETRNGKWEVRVVTDSSVRPGVVLTSRPDLQGTRGKVVAA